MAKLIERLTAVVLCLFWLVPLILNMRAARYPTLLALGKVFVGIVSSLDIPIASRINGIESDFTAIIYNKTSPVLIVNDGGAATGGFHTFTISNEGNLTETKHETPGRTKLITTVYGIDGKDLIVTIAQPDSFFRLYDANTVEQIGAPLSRTLGDWSALCVWRSQSSGEQYLYLFGKKQAVQFLIRATNGSVEIVEVQIFATPVEASSCAVSSSHAIFFGGDDDPNVYTFSAAESTHVPDITILGATEADVTGLAVYVGKNSDYLLAAQKNDIAIYDESFDVLGSVTLIGDDDVEIEGLTIYQNSGRLYPAGFITYAIESASGAGLGLSALEMIFDSFNLEINTAYNPRKLPCKSEISVCSECGYNGFCEQSAHSSGDLTCLCFTGFTGNSCESYECQNDCAGHGTCVGANQCDCDEGWGGLYCGFKTVKPVAETDGNGEDGDDPAIWISPLNKTLSRIITTTKSETGAGFGVFDLTGKKLQQLAAAEPNNVDVIYNFPAGDRSIDLAYAACRGDNTLCFFEIQQNGTLTPISGGTQPTKEDYDVYGSCVYRSPATGKQYVFVNAKTAEYLQFELSWNDTYQALETTFVRNFTGGSGGQVEGCVSDEANGWIIIGEEPRALWRYSAEPDDDTSEGFLIAEVGDGHAYADLEGVTLVEGTTANDGFILVSQQGVSAYNVYRRAAPNEYVETFTIIENAEKGIDAVSNTDGLAAVGTSLGLAFLHGLLVVHDDANQLPGSGTSDEASFKFISLGDIFSDDLLAELNPDWDPRS